MSEANSKIRSYDPKTSVVFLKTTEKFGGLSNMAPGYPLEVNGIAIRTSEALYQALRFPHMPDLQRTIIDEVSPMTAKMRTKPHRENSREDWERVRVKIMRWSLQVKLAQNLDKFGALLLSTGEAPIVEFSKKDQFWGAEPTDDGRLVGMNVLGRLLMELREQLQSNGADWFSRIEPLPIDRFELLRRHIGPVMSRRSAPADASPSRVVPRDLFSAPSPEPPQSIAQQIVPSLADLRPYPKMKDTGLAWLPRIPSHWEMWRNGRLFGARRQTGFPDLPILEVSLRSGVRVRDMESGRKQQMADRSKYLRAKKGDIAYNMMRMWQGAVGVVPEDGLVSPAYVVATPFPEADARYYAYLFRTAAYMGEVDAHSRGIVKDRNRLYWESFKQIFSSVPPLEEQRLIVRFLDWHGTLSGKLVRSKLQLTKLLVERKQALIRSIVTRGVNPNARLVPSGVDWIGDIPEGWRVIRAKYLFESIDVRSQTGSEELLTVSARDGIVPRSTKTVYMFKAASYIGHKLCWPEDLVINSLWAWADGFGFSRHHGIVSSAYGVYRLKREHRSLWEFFDLSLRSGQYKWFIQVRSKGIWKSRLQLSDQDFLDMPLVVPPLEDADRIVPQIRSATREIDATIQNIARELEFVQELRARLVEDVVSGRLDARSLAATLPEFDVDLAVDSESGATQEDDLDGSDGDGVEDAA